jgi:replicative DNA helicase
LAESQTIEPKLRGMAPGDFILIAAAPKARHKDLAYSLVLNPVRDSAASVGIISLEEDSVRVASRLLSDCANIDEAKFRIGNLENDDWPKLSDALLLFGQSSILIDDTPGLTIQQILESIREMVRKLQGKLDLVLINALPTIQRQGAEPLSEAKKEELLKEECRILNQLSREMNIVIIATTDSSMSYEALAGDKSIDD